jgi:Icc-related predicted phosphoesterase
MLVALFLYQPKKNRLKFVAISDTHSRHRSIKLPKGDVLIHAGDVSYRGEKIELVDFFNWLQKQPFEHKIFIAGNHDFFFQNAKPKDIEKLVPPGITYLNDSGITLEGIRIWGSPVTPKFFNWAFNRARGAEIKKHWNLIPEDTDLLITHGPPFGILDVTAGDRLVGDRDLLARIKEIKPQVHVFGHIHESYGTTKHLGIRCINASQVNETYDVVHKPILFTIDAREKV